MSFHEVLENFELLCLVKNLVISSNGSKNQIIQISQSLTLRVLMKGLLLILCHLQYIELDYSGF